MYFWPGTLAAVLLHSVDSRMQGGYKAPAGEEVAAQCFRARPDSRTQGAPANFGDGPEAPVRR